MKINCPYHDDKTASMELYPDGWAHCFGCGKHTTHTEQLPNSENYREDLDASIKYIKSLPIKDIRGLKLHSDIDAYYILWPDDSFYNKRFFNAELSKYKCPAGHQKQLLALRTGWNAPLVIVEGEINALSVELACQGLNVVSPGGAGDFYSKNADKYLHTYKKYAKILLLADKDKAGAMACIQLKANLIALGCTDTTIKLMEKDANDVLMQDGKEALNKIITESLGLPGRLQEGQGAVSTPGGGIT